MADALLKFPDAAEPPAKAKRRGLRDFLRRHLRVILLVLVPALAAVAGLWFYLSGGRYISTDNAYVGAQKVLITPDVSGKISRIVVREGQHVEPGDVLFEIDPEPFQLALAQAQAKLATVKVDLANLKSNMKSLSTLAELSQKSVELKQRDVERKSQLVAARTGSQFDLDTAAAAEVQAELILQFTVQQKLSTLNQLQGNPDLPVEDYPAYRQAKAAVEQAERDLNHTVLRAPISGTAAQVDNIQLGRFVPAGTPVFGVMDDAAPWVDANPKETDITYLRTGQRVTMYVDSFPDREFHGTVASVSPGTGAQFSILPPQNASGNWVKVVQRVPLRIAFTPDQDTAMLRSGMSVTVEIDTGHTRSLSKLIGSLFTSSSSAKASETPAK
ncbi:MAG: HlyD family secretion protein [Bradyrhizobiaceae bacterium]|nr:HlyD family secretion protein [Bradyrhizobiaceae bacterium]